MKSSARRRVTKLPERDPHTNNIPPFSLAYSSATFLPCAGERLSSAPEVDYEGARTPEEKACRYCKVLDRCCTGASVQVLHGVVLAEFCQGLSTKPHNFLVLCQPLLFLTFFFIITLVPLTRKYRSGSRNLTEIDGWGSTWVQHVCLRLPDTFGTVR